LVTNNSDEKPEVHGKIKGKRPSIIKKSEGKDESTPNIKANLVRTDMMLLGKFLDAS
jgi:hypothetical protein